MSFEYHEPTSLAEAVALGARFGDDGRFLAGGTDLIIQMHRGKLRPRHVVSLHRVSGLDAIDANGAVHVGALVTHRALERFPAFRGPLRALVEGAEVVGGHQVRNVGTVGGNIVNASPAADVVPVLLTLDNSSREAGLCPASSQTLYLARDRHAPKVADLALFTVKRRVDLGYFLGLARLVRDRRVGARCAAEIQPERADAARHH